MVHDFKAFPELTNSQMDLYYFQSPHKQIFDDFEAECVKVHDGDTITLRVDWRDFDFPLRFSNVSAREMKETPTRDTSSQMTVDGPTAQKWLESRLKNQDVKIRINPQNRVEKFGRLLGRVELHGIDIGEEMITLGIDATWSNRNDGKIPNGIPEIKWS